MTVSLRVMKSRRVVFTVASRSACVFVLSVCTESAEGSGAGDFEWAWTPKLSRTPQTVNAILSSIFMVGSD